MTAEQLHRFLVEVQGEDGGRVSVSDLQQIVEQILQKRHHITKFARHNLTLDDFQYYLFSSELNPPIGSQVSSFYRFDCCLVWVNMKKRTDFCTVWSLRKCGKLTQKKEKRKENVILDVVFCRFSRVGTGRWNVLWLVSTAFFPYNFVLMNNNIFFHFWCLISISLHLSSFSDYGLRSHNTKPPSLLAVITFLVPNNLINS